jgi:hypothetical protein
MKKIRNLGWFVLSVILLSIEVSNSSPSAITYTYDPAGRIVAAGYGANKSASYAYDNAGNLKVLSQPAPGLLVSRPSASQINLFWPAAPGGFVLEESPTLGADAVWTSAGATLTLSGNLWTATIPITGSVQFYRLRQP